MDKLKSSIVWLHKKLSDRRLLWLILGTFSGLLVQSQMASCNRPSTGPSVRFLATRYGLSVGHRISAQDLEVRSSNVGNALSADALTDQQLFLIEGVRLKQAVAAGEILRSSYLMLRTPSLQINEVLPPGRRAYSIRLRDRLEIHSQDRVDILMVPKNEVAPDIVLENVSVLRAANRQNEIVVALTLDELLVVEKAQQQGVLTAALRGSSENQSVHPRKKRIDKRRIPVRVPVIGGNS